MKFLLCILSFLIVSGIHTAVSATGIVVTGVLQDSTDQKSLAFANVALIHQSDSSFLTGTTTDENGQFELNVPDTGQ